jgi:hypothetical protein
MKSISITIPCKFDGDLDQLIRDLGPVPRACDCAFNGSPCILRRDHHVELGVLEHLAEWNGGLWSWVDFPGGFRGAQLVDRRSLTGRLAEVVALYDAATEETP